MANAVVRNQTEHEIIISAGSEADGDFVSLTFAPLANTTVNATTLTTIRLNAAADRFFTRASTGGPAPLVQVS